MNKHAPPEHLTSYEGDLYLWSQRQAGLIRKLKIEGLDAENVAEEIESLGRSDRRELKSRLVVLLEHLLKWQFQPDQRSSSWRGSLRESRDKIIVILKESPSLNRVFKSELPDCYALGLRYAIEETGLDTASFPVDCPYTEDQLLDRNFLPN